jgi:hypothetical protein
MSIIKLKIDFGEDKAKAGYNYKPALKGKILKILM